MSMASSGSFSMPTAIWYTRRWNFSTSGRKGAASAFWAARTSLLSSPASGAPFPSLIRTPWRWANSLEVPSPAEGTKRNDLAGERSLGIPESPSLSRPWCVEAPARVEGHLLDATPEAHPHPGWTRARRRALAQGPAPRRWGTGAGGDRLPPQAGAPAGDPARVAARALAAGRGAPLLPALRSTARERRRHHDRAPGRASSGLGIGFGGGLLLAALAAPARGGRGAQPKEAGAASGRPLGAALQRRAVARSGSAGRLDGAALAPARARRRCGEEGRPRARAAVVVAAPAARPAGRGLRSLASLDDAGAAARLAGVRAAVAGGPRRAPRRNVRPPPPPLPHLPVS